MTPLPPAPETPSAASARTRPTGAATGTDWTRTHLWEIQPVRDLLLLAALFGVLYAGYVVRVVTIPMLLALTLAYLFEPLVRLLVARRIFSRTGSAVAIILIAVIVVIVPVTIGAGYAVVKSASLASDVAENIAQVQASVAKPDDAALRARIEGKGWLAVRDYIVGPAPSSHPASTPSDGPLNGASPPVSPSQGTATESATASSAPAAAPPPSDTATSRTEPPTATTPPPIVPPSTLGPSSLTPAQRARSITRQAIDWAKQNADEIGQTVGKRVLGSGASAVSAALGIIVSVGFLGFSAFLTAFFFFYFVSGWGRVQDFWQGLIPERRREPTIELLSKMDRVIAGFVRGRLTIVGLLMIYMTTAYALIGVPGWYILGPLVGSLFIIPFAHVIGVPIAMLLMWLEPSAMFFGFQQHWWWITFAPIGVYFLAQLLDDYILSPTIQGKNTDMDTPSILFASLAGGALAGIYGLLIAIPTAACIKILLREVFWPRFKAWGQGRVRDPLPIATSEKPGP